MIHFDTSREDFEFITKIADRARTQLPEEMYDRLNPIPLQLMMDITAAHRNAMPLDLEGLLSADYENFSHGPARDLLQPEPGNRRTRKLLCPAARRTR